MASHKKHHQATGLIIKPGKRLVLSAPLAFVRRHAEGHGRAGVYADLNVTPMVDMLVMLVIFLLLTFSATGEILFMSKEIALPKAFHATELELAPVISISKDDRGNPKALAFQMAHVMDVSEITEEKFPNWELTPLLARLERTRDAWKQTGKKFDGQIIIQADDSIPFSVVKMVMLTCARADYTGMSFAVQRSTREASAMGR